MCGIWFSLAFAPDRAHIDVVAHRGPDGSGWKVFKSVAGPVALGHRRLSIIDLSEAAAQRLDYIGQGLTKVSFYPLPSFETAPALLDATLVEPQPSTTSAEYEAQALKTPM